MHHWCSQTAVQFCDFVAKHEVLHRSASVGRWYERQVGCIITSVRDREHSSLQRGKKDVLRGQLEEHRALSRES